MTIEAVKLRRLNKRKRLLRTKKVEKVLLLGESNPRLLGGRQTLYLRTTVTFILL